MGKWGGLFNLNGEMGGRVVNLNGEILGGRVFNLNREMGGGGGGYVI